MGGRWVDGAQQAGVQAVDYRGVVAKLDGPQELGTTAGSESHWQGLQAL